MFFQVAKGQKAFESRKNFIFDLKTTLFFEETSH